MAEINITTMSLDEATVVEATYPGSVTVERKPCSVRAMFTFHDSPEVRDLLDRYAHRAILPIPSRTLLIVRADLYRRARAARGGL